MFPLGYGSQSFHLSLSILACYLAHSRKKSFPSAQHHLFFSSPSSPKSSTIHISLSIISLLPMTANTSKRLCYEIARFPKVDKIIHFKFNFQKRMCEILTQQFKAYKAFLCMLLPLNPHKNPIV